MEKRTKIAIVCGSKSDLPVVEPAIEVLKGIPVDYSIHVCSAHREPTRLSRLIKDFEEDGVSVIVACAGLAAHLPGVVASQTQIPVIGVPLAAGPLNGLDALFSIVQMPKGVPVATVGIGNVKNGLYFALKICALFDPTIKDALNNKTSA